MTHSINVVVFSSELNIQPEIEKRQKRFPYYAILPNLLSQKCSDDDECFNLLSVLNYQTISIKKANKLYWTAYDKINFRIVRSTVLTGVGLN